MKLRKICLRIMLVSLAAAAAMGVLAMLFFRQEVIVRVIGTAVMTAVAAALMMTLSLLADHEKSRWSGIAGMAAVVTEFILGLFLTWGVDNFFNDRWIGPVGILMLTIACSALPAMFFLRLIFVAGAKISGWVGLGICAAVLLFFAVPPWFDTSWSSYADWYGTAFCVGGFGLLASVSFAGAGTDRRYWRYAGVLAAVAGCAMGTVGIWQEMHRGVTPFVIVTTVAAFIAHANLVLLCPLKPAQRWLAYATIAASLLTGVFVDVIVYLESSDQAGLFGRLAGATGILAACGSLALLILAGLNRKIKAKPTLTKITEYTLICPGCNRKQTLAIGDTQCPTCRLGIHVSFDEPRCPKCDYLLYMLNSDRCPECGTVIGPSHPITADAPALPIVSPGASGVP